LHEARRLRRPAVLAHEVEADVRVAAAAVGAVRREPPTVLPREVADEEARAGVRARDLGRRVPDHVDELARAVPGLPAALAAHDVRARGELDSVAEAASIRHADRAALG